MNIVDRFCESENMTEEQAKSFKDAFFGYPHVYEPPEDKDLARYYYWGSNAAITYYGKTGLDKSFPDEF